ncbi:hypothetical protein SSP24_84190 [Streptomyces spinoverrucosus]|uniref:Uncharacterized protein n=1 Tax=Streptomyces spinoverrucosus TaxID=284043 RepID=A0A4Y3VUW7_9ACTN|nr:hypothetical protein [Streptomyces spinoverrucosus]GEC10764.1 hypothetical protein SSP24_84190 [Streptomyces spinoverrucosus]GHC00104.1 hypothetical protein GCM10010397_85120 [Streptomyces spinoverrucosus]
MVSGTRAAHNIEITAESLQEDLARLKVQKQALERELAAVVAHLGSVQRALSALEVLMLDTAGAAPADAPTAAVPGPHLQASAPSEPQSDIASSAPAVAASKAEARSRKPGSRQAAEGPADSGAATDADGQRKYGKLTEQILEYFATVGNADVRARDVAAALGRDTDSGSINAVRSTLDRLVGTSRIRRTGRGLYRAKRS